MKTWKHVVVGTLVLTSVTLSQPVTAKTPITCQSIRDGLDRPDVVDVDDIDFVMHAAGCDDDPYQADTNWQPDRSSRCARRAYWLVRHGHSIFRASQKLTHRGCVQFEDGTYSER